MPLVPQVGIFSDAFYGSLMRRNRLINGAMEIDQRNSGVSVTPTSTTYTLDRWQLEATQPSKLSVAQVSSVSTDSNYDSSIGYSPSLSFPNFTRFMRVRVASQYTPLQSDSFTITQHIEGQNIIDWSLGTSRASRLSLSFYARTSSAGISLSIALRNAADTRSYTSRASITSSWQKFTVRITGDTSGTWLKNNGKGLSLSICLGQGSDYTSATGDAWETTVGSVKLKHPSGGNFVASTTNTNLWITGLQLEQHNEDNPFEFYDRATELAMCQRYYEKGNGSLNLSIGSGFPYSNGRWNSCFHQFSNTKRAAPIVSTSTSNFSTDCSPGVQNTNVITSESTISPSTSGFLTTIGGSATPPTSGSYVYWDYSWAADAEL